MTQIFSLYIYFLVESLEKVGLKVVILSRFYPAPGSSASGAWRVSVACGHGGHQWSAPGVSGHQPHLMWDTWRYRSRIKWKEGGAQESRDGYPQNGRSVMLTFRDKPGKLINGYQALPLQSKLKMNGNILLTDNRRWCIFGFFARSDEVQSRK